MSGGVWRIKKSDNLLALACMNSGFYLVEAETGAKRVSYEEHGSLAYGVDWKRRMGKDSPVLLASCSFYDHLLNVWEMLNPEDGS